MAKAATIAGIFVALAIVGYAGFTSLFPTYRVRYQLDLEVEDNGQSKFFSQVVEFNYSLLPDSLVSGYSGRKFGGEFHGAAPTIDLGEKGLVFIIDRYSSDRWTSHCYWQSNNKPNPSCVRSVTLDELPFRAFGYPVDVMPSVAASYLFQIQRRHDTVSIPIADLPMMIRFRDKSDPHSLEEVDPRDFVRIFGPGYSVVRASLRLTSAPIGGPSAKWPPFLARISKELQNGTVQEKLMKGELLDEVSGTIARIHQFEQIYITDFLK